MIGRHTKVYEETSKYIRELLTGVILSVDPSIGSTSSQPGWAVYRATRLVSSGTLSIPPSGTIPERLRLLNNLMRKLYREYSPDIVVYEEIPAQRHGGGNANAHASLLKALGVILSIPGPDGHIGILPISWKPLVRENYIKSDERDAIELGWIVIELARKIQCEKEKKETGKKKEVLSI